MQVSAFWLRQFSEDVGMSDGSGLRGLTSGLERGVGLASTIIDGKRRRAFEDERMGMAREQHQRAGLQFQREGERHDRLMKTYDVNAERDTQRFEWEGQEKREQAQARKQNARLKRLQIEEAELKRDLPAIQSAYQKIVTGRPELLDESEIEAIKRNPRYNPVKLGDPSVGEALKIAQMALKGEVGMRDPKVVEAANILFEADINKGSKGSKRITRFAPGRESGTLVFELDADGNLQPMTAGRGTSDDGDNEVLQQPLADLVKRVAGMQTLHGALQTTEAKSAVAQLGPLFGLLQGDREQAPGLSTEDARLWDRLERRFTSDKGYSGKVTDWASVADEFRKMGREDLAQLASSSGGSPIDTASPEFLKAEEMAKKWVDGQAGWGSLDSTDFAEYGGNREAAQQAKTIEYYQQLTGKRPGLSLTPQQAGGMEEVDITKAGSGQSVGSQAGGKPIQVSTKAERDALPSGTLYIDPAGQVRRKP